MTESVIDFPKDTLCPEVWEKGLDADGVKEVWKLKPDVRKQILSICSDVCPEAKVAHITGSITSNSYVENADIDLHFLDIGIKFKSQKENDEYQKQLRSKLNGQKIGSHPIEVYYQENEFQDLMSIGCYDVFKQKWLVGPEMVDSRFNPYEKYYDDVQKKSEGLAKKIRNTIFSIYEIAVVGKKNLNSTFSDNIREILKKRLSEVKSLYDTIRNSRKVYSSPESKEQALKYRSSKKWKIADAAFKLFDKYGYTAILKKFIEDGNLLASSDEVYEDVIEDLLNTVKSYINNADKLAEEELFEAEQIGAAEMKAVSQDEFKQILKQLVSQNKITNTKFNIKQFTKYFRTDPASHIWHILVGNDDVYAAASVTEVSTFTNNAKDCWYVEEIQSFISGGNYGKKLLEMLIDKYKNMCLLSDPTGGDALQQKVYDTIPNLKRIRVEDIRKDVVRGSQSPIETFYYHATSKKAEKCLITQCREITSGFSNLRDTRLVDSEQLDEGAKNAISSFALALALLIPGLVSAKTTQAASQTFKTDAVEVQKKQNEYLSRLNGHDPHKMMNGYEMWQALNILAVTLFGEGRNQIKSGGLDPITDSILNRTAKTPDINRVANICVGRKTGRAFQYSFWNEHTSALATIKSGEPVVPSEIKLNILERRAWETCLRRAVEVMTGNYKIKDRKINSYHVTDMDDPPTWSSQMKNVKVVGDHKFGYVATNDPSVMDMATMTPVKSVVKAKANAKSKTPTVQKYTIKQGDTLWKIAKDHKTTMASLAAKNKIDVNAMLKPGQKLTI